MAATQATPKEASSEKKKTSSPLPKLKPASTTTSSAPTLADVLRSESATALAKRAALSADDERKMWVDKHYAAIVAEAHRAARNDAAFQIDYYVGHVSRDYLDALTARLGAAGLCTSIRTSGIAADRVGGIIGRPRYELVVSWPPIEEQAAAAAAARPTNGHSTSSSFYKHHGQPSRRANEERSRDRERDRDNRDRRRRSVSPPSPPRRPRMMRGRR